MQPSDVGEDVTMSGTPRHQVSRELLLSGRPAELIIRLLDCPAGRPIADLGRQLPLAMLVNECLLVHVTHSTADVPVSANSGHWTVLGRASEKGRSEPFKPAQPCMVGRGRQTDAAIRWTRSPSSTVTARVLRKTHGQHLPIAALYNERERVLLRQHDGRSAQESRVTGGRCARMRRCTWSSCLICV